MKHNQQSRPSLQLRTRRSEIRWTEDEYALLVRRSRQAGLTVSRFVRHAALNQKFVSTVDVQWLGELRRIGALIKHNYPAVSTWTAQEKKNYWQTRERLLALAEQFAQKIGVAKPKRKFN